MNTLTWLLGLEAEPAKLTLLQMSTRAVGVFLAAISMVRLSERRSLTKKSPFDQILLVILASVLSRAINSSAGFFTTLAVPPCSSFSTARLLLLPAAGRHWRPQSRGGPRSWSSKLQRKELRRQYLSPADLMEDMRLGAKLEEIEKVKVGRLEVSGDVSFILQEKEVA